MKRVLQTLISSVITLSSYLSSAEDDVFIQIYTELSEPNSYIANDSDEGPVTGHVTNLVRAVMHEAGYDYDISLVPWARAVHAIDNSANVMVYSMARSQDREHKYHWIGKTLPLDYYLYGLKENLEFLPRTLEEAKNSRVGVIRADVVGNYLETKEFNNLVYVRDPSLNIVMLQRGRIDLFPYTKLHAGMFVRGNGFNENDLVGVIRLEEMADSMYISVSKETSRLVVDRLEWAYQKVVESGEFQRIMEPLLRDYQEIEIEILGQ